MKRLLVVIGLLLALAIPAWGQTVVEPTPDFIGAEYKGEPQVEVAWDACEGATSYEVVVEWIDPPTPVLVSTQVVKTTTAILTKPSRSGHFVAKVRSCNDLFNFAWSATEGATSYEIVVEWIYPQGTVVTDTQIVTTTNAVFTLPPNGGTHNAKYRSIYSDGSFSDWSPTLSSPTPLPACSDWSLSTDPAKATVQGQAMGWRIFWRTSPPGGVIIS